MKNKYVHKKINNRVKTMKNGSKLIYSDLDKYDYYSLLSRNKKISDFKRTHAKKRYKELGNKLFM